MGLQTVITCRTRFGICKLSHLANRPSMLKPTTLTGPCASDRRMTRPDGRRFTREHWLLEIFSRGCSPGSQEGLTQPEFGDHSQRVAGQSVSGRYPNPVAWLSRGRIGPRQNPYEQG